MPTIEAQLRKPNTKAKQARKDLDADLRTICAPAMSTPSYPVKRSSGLTVNIVWSPGLDAKLDMFLDIDAFGPPEVPDRDIELITAQIKAGLIEVYPKARMAGWVRVGADKRWFSTSTPSPSVEEILAEREKVNMTMEDFLPRPDQKLGQVRAKLKRADIHTVADLIAKTAEEVQSIDQLGDGGMKIIHDRLANIGLSLKEP